MSPKGEKNTWSLGGNSFLPMIAYIFPTRFLNYLLFTLPNRTWIPPALNSLPSWARSCLSPPTTIKHQDKSYEQRAPHSHTALVCSLQILWISEIAKFFGEWQQKNLHKVRFPYSYLSREENGAIQRRKSSYPGKGSCWALESWQGMRGCFQNWRPREKQIRGGTCPVNLPQRRKSQKINEGCVWVPKKNSAKTVQSSLVHPSKNDSETQFYKWKGVLIRRAFSAVTGQDVERVQPWRTWRVLGNPCLSL